MSDFIKEFNMIDFMGMIFPGSVTVLLFGAETDLWYKMKTLWGAAPEMAAKLVFIIVMGYFAGMLLHEVGDILEYLTGWSTPLNPRGCAAVVTGLARVSIPQYDSEAEKRSECRQQAKSVFGAMMFLVEMLSIVAISGVGKRLAQWIISRQWGKSALNWGVNTLKIPGHTWNTMVAALFFICAFALELAALHGVMIRFFSRASETHSDETEDNEAKKEKSHKKVSPKVVSLICPPEYKDFRVKLNWLIRSDALFMQSASSKTTCRNTDAKSKMENTSSDSRRKRVLFDGFRTMARNMLVAMAFLCLYAKTSDGWMRGVYTRLTASGRNCVILLGVLVILFVRFWHYSYLRFKYIYEDYLYGLPSGAAADERREPCDAARG